MNGYDKYYKKLQNAKEHSNIELLSDLALKDINAIELGCGSGRDTVALLKLRI